MPPSRGTYDEKDLLVQLRGDEVAFNHLYRRYGNRIYGKLLKFTKSAEVAEDLLQDLFMKVWEKRTGYQDIFEETVVCPDIKRDIL